MKIVELNTIRRLENDARKALKTAEPTLMEKASKLCAEKIYSFKQRHRALDGCEIVIFAGRGNNGGDGILCGSYLNSLYGEKVTIYSLQRPSEMSDEIFRHFSMLNSAVSVKFIGNDGQVTDMPERCIIVDAVLGIGFKGELHGRAKEVVKFINSVNFPVISIDIPSGIECDSGVGCEAIYADMTITIGAEKKGLYLADGRIRSGVVKFADIGFDLSKISDEEADFETIPSDLFERFFVRPAEEFYKNKNGRLLVIGGSKMYPGAVVLSILGADSAGCGLLTAAIKARPFAEIPPSVIVRDFSDGGTVCFNGRDADELARMAANQDAVVFGMGATANSDVAEVIKTLLQSPQKLIFDADALNTVAMFPAVWQNRTHNNIIITPHHQEAVRLAQAFGIADFNSMPRHLQAQALAGKMQCIVVLKGDKTVIAAPDKRTFVNQCGSYALAKGGSGDILSGVIGALAAKNSTLSLHETAALGVFIHAAAADFAAQSRTVFNINKLPDAIRDYIGLRTIN